MALVVDEPKSSESIDKRAKKQRKLEKKAPAEASEVSKAERKARREAKRLAKLEAKSTSHVPHSKSTPLTSSKSELEVLKLLEPGPSSDGVPTVQKEKRSKMKGKKRDRDDEAVVDSIGDGEVGERGRKKNRKEEKKHKTKRSEEPQSKEEIDILGAPTQKDSEPGSDAKKDKKTKKVKKRKPDSDADPISPLDDIKADESLSEQGVKAMIYVHSHATSHLKTAKHHTDDGQAWKFSKARQNWLVRHVWDDTQVPEKYLAMVLGYLKTIQGLGRSGLIETAKRYASTEEPANDQIEGQELSEGQDGIEPKSQATLINGDNDTSKTVRFIDQPQEASENEEKEESLNQLELLEERRNRAKKLLNALGAR